MKKALFDRLERLDGSKRPKVVVLATLPGEGEVEVRALAPLTCEEWERQYCRSEETERSKR
jgi:hypothetical protein